MLTSRGCPGKCIFCAATALSGGAYRTRSVESIIYELEYLSYLEIKEVFFADDTFTADVERLNNLMERIIKTGTKYSWYCESRVDAINEESIKMMKLAGCKAIQFGIETGSDSMLNKVGKEINLKKIHKACEIATKYGIKLSCSFIIGLPNETPFP